MNLFLGTWVANLEKSRRHANHQFQSATLTFDVSGDVVSLTHAGVNMAGKAESGTTVLHADGTNMPYRHKPPEWWRSRSGSARTRSQRRQKRIGRPVGNATYAVSDDGKILTATVEGIDAAGKAFEQVIVFDRRSHLD
jgi:hypothetical protein